MTQKIDVADCTLLEVLRLERDFGEGHIKAMNKQVYWVIE